MAASLRGGALEWYSSELDHMDRIGKFNLGPIHLADLASNKSTPIHSRVLLIHLRVVQLVMI